jgi:hypothetical protein
MNEPIEIPLNKKKIVPHILGALVFVLLATVMLADAFQLKNQPVTQAFVFLIGLAGILFFGLISIVLSAKLLKNKVGMIISDEGLIDNSSGLPAGFIPWKDIRKINFTATGYHRFLVIIVKKPGKYIERESNFLKRAAMWLNYKIAGSPIHILASFLEVDFYTLNEMIAQKRYQKKHTGEESKT